MVETRIVGEESLEEIIKVLKNGELVALPTETVYGLAADITQEKALKKIFEVKGRPSDNPLIVHIASIEEVPKYAKNFPNLAKSLFLRFSPGPLTLVLEKKEQISSLVSAGLSTIALRIPKHPFFLRVLAEGKLALAAPSANLSGFPSPTSAEHCYQDLKGKIPFILEGGVSDIGIESTVLRLNAPYLELLRPGHISVEDLEQFLEDYVLETKEIWTLKNLSRKTLENHESPASPGMKYRHYAPKAKVLPYDFQGALDSNLLMELKTFPFKCRLGVVYVSDLKESLEKNLFELKEQLAQQSNINLEWFYLDGIFSSKDSLKNQIHLAAKQLYAQLKKADDEQADVVLIPYFAKKELQIKAEAYHNRLFKASGL